MTFFASWTALALLLLLVSAQLTGKDFLECEEETEQSFCGISIQQGMRKSQEDRVLCATLFHEDSSLQLNFAYKFARNQLFDGPGSATIDEIEFTRLSVQLMAIFDGHGGSEASEFLFTQFYQTFRKEFLLSLTESEGSVTSAEEIHTMTNFPDNCLLVNESMTSWVGSLEIMKELLKRSLEVTLMKLDEQFLNEYGNRGVKSGSTACISLALTSSAFDTQFIVANVGDSRAIICREPLNATNCSAVGRRDLSYTKKLRRLKKAARDHGNRSLSTECLGGSLCVEILHELHNPDRTEELERIYKLGGFVTKYSGVARLSGQLAVSRAIGDIDFRPFLISDPEFTEWMTISSNKQKDYEPGEGCGLRGGNQLLLNDSEDVFLIVSSDGVFESLTPQQVCTIVCLEDRGLDVESLFQLSAPENRKSSSESTVSAKDVCSGSRNDLVDRIASSVSRAAIGEGSYDNVAVAVTKFLLPDDSCGKADPKQQSNALSVRVMSTLLSVPNQQYCYLLEERIQSHLVLRGRASETSLIEYTSLRRDDGKKSLTSPNSPSVSPRSTARDLFTVQSTALVQSYHAHLICPIVLGTDICSTEPPAGLGNFLDLIFSFPKQFPALLPPSVEEKSEIDDSSDLGFAFNGYILGKNFGRGGFGEVWFARKSCCATQGVYPNLEFQPEFVLKKIFKGSSRLSGHREIHFGQLFRNASQMFPDTRSHKNGAEFPGAESSEEDSSDFSTYPDDSSNEQVSGIMGGLKSFSFRQTEIVNDRKESPRYLARYVESFESDNDLWIVFQNEGKSLSSLLYKIQDFDDIGQGQDHTKGFKIVQNSDWWKWLRLTDEGQVALRELIRQLLLGVAEMHTRNVTHRDIKPENILIQKQGSDSEWTTSLLYVRIADFGSAVDEYSLSNHYPPSGPSRSEQSDLYSPPEILLTMSSPWHPASNSTAFLTPAFDLWSVGVVILELFYGSPHVFSLHPRTIAKLNQRFEGWDESAKETAYLLRALTEMCIFGPKHSILATKSNTKQSDESRKAELPVPWECTEAALLQHVKSRDPLGMGLVLGQLSVTFGSVLLGCVTLFRLPDVSLLRLIRGLLQWNPADRVSAMESLENPFFK